jgi:hypothetical protein
VRPRADLPDARPTDSWPPPAAHPPKALRGRERPTDPAGGAACTTRLTRALAVNAGRAAHRDRVLLRAKEVNAKSPTVKRMVKFALNLIDDGLVGQQVVAGEATRLGYVTDEAQEGRDSFLEKRDPDCSRFPYRQ